MKSTGRKLMRTMAGDPRPTAAISKKVVAAIEYAGATLATAIAVVSKRLRVLPRS
jgi:hypothetical protein